MALAIILFVFQAFYWDHTGKRPPNKDQEDYDRERRYGWRRDG